MTVGTFFQQGINYYVPQMAQSPGVGDDGIYSVSLGTPIVATTNNVVAAAPITNAALTISGSNRAGLPFVTDALYGRTLQLAGGTAGDNAAVIVRGVDYLGQPVAEQFTLSGTGAVTGNKCFKRVDSIAVPAGNANANSTINVGVSARLGLPFKTSLVLAEFNGDVLAAAGTLNQPVLTDPQTLVTGEPRGWYLAATTLNGTNNVSITARASRAINAANNGGLHGIRHFFA